MFQRCGRANKRQGGRMFVASSIIRAESRGKPHRVGRYTVVRRAQCGSLRILRKTHPCVRVRDRASRYTTPGE